jgi:hypothetical protein
MEIAQSNALPIDDKVSPPSGGKSIEASSHLQVIVACNTTAAQYFISQVSRSAINPLFLSYTQFLDENSTSSCSGVGPHNATCAFRRVALGLDRILQFFAPVQGDSFFKQSLRRSNLTSFRIFYDGKVTAATSHLFVENTRNGTNTPASERWTLSIAFQFQGNLSETIRQVTYLANGSIDTTATSSVVLQEITDLLQPTLTLVRRVLGDDFDFWRTINLFVVGYYWILLADVGQISPTTYPPVNQYLRVVDFSEVQYHPSTNNIFRNPLLFSYYTSYLNERLEKTVGSNYLLPEFMPLEGENLLNATTTTICRTYTCLQRKRKHIVNLLFSVLGVSFSLIMTMAVILSFGASQLEPHRDLCGHAVDLQKGDIPDGSAVMLEEPSLLEELSDEGTQVQGHHNETFALRDITQPQSSESVEDTENEMTAT